MTKDLRLPPLDCARLRLPLAAAACLLLAACQLWPFNPEAQDEPAPPVEEPAEVAPARPSVSIESALDLLQEGQEGPAEAMLAELSAQRPSDPTVRLLLAQIRRPPEELLGETYEEVEVQSGESLSAIAGRTIDNELLFYSLAKLNEIEVPRLLRVGQRIKVPSMQEMPDGAETAAKETEEAEEDRESEQDTAVGAVESPAADSDDAVPVEQTARRLVEQARFSQAYSLLLTAARAGKLSAQGRSLLAEAAVALSQDALRQDDLEQGDKYLRQAEPWVSARPDRLLLERQQARVEAHARLSEAERHLEDGDAGAAFEALSAARDLDGKLSEAQGPRLDRLSSRLAVHYHDLAVSAWRDQEVDRSVELWSRVVDIDPDFEPARRYLERARRAQQELRNLEGG